MATKNDLIILEFSKNLELTNQLVQNLLQNLHEGEVDFIALKTELEILTKNVDMLVDELGEKDRNIQDLKLKIELINILVNDLKLRINDTTKEETALKATERQGKWQLFTGITTALIALIGTIIAIALNYLK
jgi:predicted metalloenzyme YecM